MKKSPIDFITLIVSQLSRLQAEGAPRWIGFVSYFHHMFPGLVVMAGLRAIETQHIVDVEIAGLSEAETRTYLETIDPQHPWRDLELVLPPRIAHNGVDALAKVPAGRANQDAMRSFAAFEGFTHGYLLIIPIASDRFGFLFVFCDAQMQPRLGDRIRLTMQLLMRPLSRAFADGPRPDALEPGARFYVDRRPGAALLIDPAGNVLHRNAAATHFMAADSFLRSTSTGRVPLGSPEAQAVFVQNFKSHHAEWPQSPASPIIFRDNAANGPIILRLFPFAPASFRSTAQGTLLVAGRQTLVTVSSMRIEPEKASRLLQRTFALSAVESALLLRLAEGDTLKEIAAQRGISFFTARNQLHSACGKLGVSRQTEAVALILRIVLAAQS